MTNEQLPGAWIHVPIEGIVDVYLVASNEEDERRVADWIQSSDGRRDIIVSVARARGLAAA